MYGAKDPGKLNPDFLGDISGDWDKEVTTTNEANDELIMFTEDQPTERRLNIFAHDPALSQQDGVGRLPPACPRGFYIGNGTGQPPKSDVRFIGA